MLLVAVVKVGNLWYFLLRNLQPVFVYDTASKVLQIRLFKVMFSSICSSHRKCGIRSETVCRVVASSIRIVVQISLWIWI